jgi:hypothetical protein
MSGDDYEVGYGKPPRSGQFQAGRSGNPKGRRKGSKNVGSMVKSALDDKVMITIEGRRRKVTKLEAAFMQQANKAAGGDAKATKLMLDILGAATAHQERTAAEQVSPANRRELDELLLDSMRTQFEGNDDED